MMNKTFSAVMFFAVFGFALVCPAAQAAKPEDKKPSLHGVRLANGGTIRTAQDISLNKPQSKKKHAGKPSMDANPSLFQDVG